MYYIVLCHFGGKYKNFKYRHQSSKKEKKKKRPEPTSGLITGSFSVLLSF